MAGGTKKTVGEMLLLIFFSYMRCLISLRKVAEQLSKRLIRAYGKI